MNLENILTGIITVLLLPLGAKVHKLDVERAEIREKLTSIHADTQLLKEHFLGIRSRE